LFGGINAGQLRIDIVSKFQYELSPPCELQFHRQFRTFEWWFEFSETSSLSRFDGIKTVSQSVAIPLWSLVLLTAVPIALIFRTDWKRRRIEREGLCPKCGYDLRGHAAEVRDRMSEVTCPECGAERAV